MEGIVFAFFGLTVLWTKAVLFPEKPEEAPPEDELIKALGKCLKKGMKISVQVDEKEKDKDK